jgi:hypothetical protein
MSGLVRSLRKFWATMLFAWAMRVDVDTTFDLASKIVVMAVRAREHAGVLARQARRR